MNSIDYLIVTKNYYTICEMLFSLQYSVFHNLSETNFIKQDDQLYAGDNRLTQ
jgi:hypothetical protein